jgi:membrane protein implicated in regulation of membrane protease activity
VLSGRGGKSGGIAGFRPTRGLGVYSPPLLMWLLYLVAVVLGGGSLLVQMFAGGDHGDPGHGLDHGDASHPDGPGILSTRSVIYGLFTFGFVGGLLHIPRIVEPRVALTVAIVSAVAAAVGVGYVFQSLGHAGASGAAALDEVRGRKARVLVACARGQRGKVRVQLKGHQVDVLATTDEERIAEGTEVMIVDVRDGVAHVATGGSREEVS